MILPQSTDPPSDTSHSVSRKRKQIKKERQCIEINNLDVKLLRGDDLQKQDLDFFYECYLDTTGRKWGSTYLKKEFFMVGSDLLQLI